jgi:hypothetical protein
LTADVQAARNKATQRETGVFSVCMCIGFF